MAVQKALGIETIPGRGLGRGATRSELRPQACPHPPSSNVSLLLLQDYLDALAGICYDGIEGLLYLGLFSLLAALAFSTMICAGPRAWKHFTTRWAARGLPGGAHRRLCSVTAPRADNLGRTMAAGAPGIQPQQAGWISAEASLRVQTDPQKEVPRARGRSGAESMVTVSYPHLAPLPRPLFL